MRMILPDKMVKLGSCTKRLYGDEKNPLKEATRLKTQKVVKIIYVRFKVTICLYLSPNITARSLSTLMAVIVIRVTKGNT